VYLFPFHYIKRRLQGETFSTSSGDSDGLDFGTRFIDYKMRDGTIVTKKCQEYGVDPNDDVTDPRHPHHLNYMNRRTRKLV